MTTLSLLLSKHDLNDNALSNWLIKLAKYHGKYNEKNSETEGRGMYADKSYGAEIHL